MAGSQTLKEKELETERMASENLNLKMRVQHLEEMLGDRSSANESMNIWDMRSALTSERERILEEAAREVTERDELLARSQRTLEELRAENLELRRRVHEMEAQALSREAELKDWAHRQQNHIELVRSEEQQRCRDEVRRVQEEDQALARQELDKMEADMVDLREELQRKMASALDDLHRRLRDAERALVAKEDELRATQVNMREWAQREIEENVEREVHRVRHEERQAAQKVTKRLRDDLEDANKMLERERNDRAESQKEAAEEVESALQALHDERLRLKTAEEEVLVAQRRAQDAEKMTQTLQAELEAVCAEQNSHAKEALHALKEDLRRRDDAQRHADAVIIDLHRQVDNAKQANNVRTAEMKSENVAEMKRELQDCKQRLEEEEEASKQAEDRVRTLEKLIDVEARKSAQAVRSAELARKALLQAEDARRQHQHLADDRHREISSLKRQLEEFKDQHDSASVLDRSSPHVRSDARLMSVPPPTPYDKIDLAAALANQRERAIEAEEDLRVMSNRARQAERRAREAEEDLRTQHERAKEAEGEVQRLHQRVLELERDQHSFGKENRRSLQHESRREDAATGTHGAQKRVKARAGRADGAAEGVRGSSNSDSGEDRSWTRQRKNEEQDNLARALDKVQAKSKECARLESEVHTLEEEAKSMREAEKERERLVQARTHDCERLKEECAQLQEEILQLRDEANGLRERQSDIEREADLVAQLLMQAESNTNLSATRLVQEALAKCESGGGGAGALTATALVRDALAQHVKGEGEHSMKDSDGGLQTPSLDALTSSLKKAAATQEAKEWQLTFPSPSADDSPAAPRVVSFAQDAGAFSSAGKTRNDSGARRSGDGQPSMRELAEENWLLRNEVGVLQAKVSDLQGKLETAVQERGELLEKVEKIEQAANRDIDTNLRISISDANRRVAQVQMQLASAVAERDEARRVSSDLKSMMADVLQRQAADLQQQHSHEIEALRQHSEALQTENAALLLWRDGHLNEHGEKVSERNGVSPMSKASKEQEQTIVESLCAERANLLKERDALQQRNEHLARQEEECFAEISRLKSKLDDMQAYVARHHIDDKNQGQTPTRCQSPNAREDDVKRLRECNRLVILELEDTRQRLREERQRRYSAECCVIAGSTASEEVAAAARKLSQASVERAGNGGPHFRAPRCDGIAKPVLPPVEETPVKAPQVRLQKLCLPAPEESLLPSQFQTLFRGFVHDLIGTDADGWDQANDNRTFAVARASAAHTSSGYPAESHAEPPSPQPYPSQPAGLQASYVEGVNQSNKRTNGRGSDNVDVDLIQDHSEQPGLAEASIMTLSHAALRHLSREPDDSGVRSQTTAGADMDPDMSLFGLSKSAVREASAPQGVSCDFSAALTHMAHTPSSVPDDGVKQQSSVRSQLQPQVRDLSQQETKGFGKTWHEQSASHLRSARKPLSTLTGSDINSHTLHGLRRP